MASRVSVLYFCSDGRGSLGSPCWSQALGVPGEEFSTQSHSKSPVKGLHLMSGNQGEAREAGAEGETEVSIHQCVKMAKTGNYGCPEEVLD